MLRMALLISAAFAGATWAEAETIDVKYYGKLDLTPFACTDIVRSSFVNRACYDRAKQFMVVQLKTVYYPYCEMPARINRRSEWRLRCLPIFSQDMSPRSIGTGHR